MNKFYVLVGSNIKPQINIEKGIDLIHKSKIIEIESMSKEYHSDPVGMDGNSFINMVLKCKTKSSFRETLSELKKHRATQLIIMITKTEDEWLMDEAITGQVELFLIFKTLSIIIAHDRLMPFLIPTFAPLALSI